MKLHDIVTISSYASQGSDDAFHMVSCDVISLLRTHFPQDQATLVALESLHFVAEAYTNPDFNNIDLLVEYVWRTAAIWEMQEMYIKDVAQLDAPSDCLPSHQFRTAIQFAA